MPTLNFFTSSPTPELINDLSTQLNQLPQNAHGRFGIMRMIGENGNNQYVSVLSCLPVIQCDTLSVTIEDILLLPKYLEAQLSDQKWMDGTGQSFTLESVIENWISQYPDKPYFQGGKAIELRKAQWTAALKQACFNPTVMLVNRFNQEFKAQGYQLAEIREIWLGDSPSWEIRHNGSFYCPPSSVKPLLERLCVGLEIVPDAPQMTPLKISTIEIPALYVDEYLLVVNKPTLLSSVPGVRENFDCKSILEDSYGPLWVVHRLDLDTSGILVFARSQEACEAMSRLFREDLVTKSYIARLEGVPEMIPDRIEFPLAINPLDRPKQCVLNTEQTGKPCVTKVKPLHTVMGADGVEKQLVELMPQTGRTHQLRLHCAHPLGLGMPIDGDPFYGRIGMLDRACETRLCLHAQKLKFQHPFTHEYVELYAPAYFPDFVSTGLIVQDETH